MPKLMLVEAVDANDAGFYRTPFMVSAIKWCIDWLIDLLFSH
jgi:hypothetical protein